MEENQYIILFSALDWGLGHTTRSIPILTHFNKKGAQLLIAVQPDSASEKILRRHFPKAIYLPLQGYGITYAKKGNFFALKIILQIPKILKAIRKERRFVKTMVASYPIRLIIADNRYGFYHKSVTSVFITHQLRIAAPCSLLERMIQGINYNYIQRFSQLWVPDIEGSPNLGGKLSHPAHMPKVPTFYIGLLSRLSSIKTLRGWSEKQAAKLATPFKYLFLLSGPEPQRSILEQKLLTLAGKLNGNSILVRGLPAEKQGLKSGNTNPSSEGLAEAPPLQVISYADPDTLILLLARAEFVICRSGYSTVMDLLMLEKKGIYIPTPGQTEQQYLAERLMQNHWGFYFSQENPDYLGALSDAEAFHYCLPKDFSTMSTRIPTV